jgi:hypothetical protein
MLHTRLPTREANSCIVRGPQGKAGARVLVANGALNANLNGKLYYDE